MCLTELPPASVLIPLNISFTIYTRSPAWPTDDKFQITSKYDLIIP